MLIEEIFEFERNRFTFRIRGGNEKIETLSKEGITKFWKKLLKLDSDKEIKFYWDKGPKKSRHRIMVTLGSIIFRHTLDEIMDIVLSLSLTNKKGIYKGFICRRIRSKHSIKPIGLFDITDKGKNYLEKLKSKFCL